MSHTESSQAKVRSLSAPSVRRRSKYSNVKQNDDQPREAVGEPKKASYRGTQVSSEVVIVPDFSRIDTSFDFTDDSIKVIKDQCEMPDDVIPNTLSFGVSSEINHKKLQTIEHLIQKLTRLNSTHDEAHTDYIASLSENTKPDDRKLIFDTVNEVLANKLALVNTMLIHPRHSNSDGDAVKITIVGSSTNGGQSKNFSLSSTSHSDIHTVEEGSMLMMPVTRPEAQAIIMRDKLNDLDFVLEPT
ncbi:protein longifolia 1 [Tanacetum coccineum]|uniref:Protein longifolia 1 n=1 Tax=Tanacetum coccineum TaxID=301880 RepID=A0ABQ5GP35_9ASTR